MNKSLIYPLSILILTGELLRISLAGPSICPPGGRSLSPLPEASSRLSTCAVDYDGLHTSRYCISIFSPLGRRQTLRVKVLLEGVFGSFSLSFPLLLMASAMWFAMLLPNISGGYSQSSTLVCYGPLEHHANSEAGGCAHLPTSTKQTGGGSHHELSRL